jgi:gliding motility-associated-like protein
LNNLETTTYTFTPDLNQCASETTITIAVNQLETPVFDAIVPICVGEPLNPLPIISTNGISGSWLPALNNLETTTYTFTPDLNQCASETTITITVNPLNNPAFDFGNAVTLCPNDDFSLPEISSNGIEGSWLPNEVDFTQNQTYIFTPFDNVCANNFSLEININETFDVVINQACFDSDFTLFVSDSSNQNFTFSWFNDLGINIGNDSAVVIDETGEFTLEATLNGCTQAFYLTVLNIYCDIPKGVSPNDDTYNDTFDLSNFEVSNLQIYNRYGLEVYQKTNYTNEWVGNSNSGDELPSATYFYVVSFQSGQQKSGWVYLNREN